MITCHRHTGGTTSGLLRRQCPEYEQHSVTGQRKKASHG